MYNWTRIFLVTASSVILGTVVVLLILIRLYNLELSTETRGDNLFLFYFLAIPLSVFSLLLIRHKKLKDISWVDISFGSLVLVFLLIGGFWVSMNNSGTWVTDTVLFESKTSDAQIVDETLEYGVFGSGGHRIVEKEEFLYYFHKIKHIINIETMDSSKWIPVHKALRGA